MHPLFLSLLPVPSATGAPHLPDDVQGAAAPDGPVPLAVTLPDTELSFAEVLVQTAGRAPMPAEQEITLSADPAQTESELDEGDLADDQPASAPPADTAPEAEVEKPPLTGPPAHRTGPPDDHVAWPLAAPAPSRRDPQPSTRMPLPHTGPQPADLPKALQNQTAIQRVEPSKQPLPAPIQTVAAEPTTIARAAPDHPPGRPQSPVAAPPPLQEPFVRVSPAALPPQTDIAPPPQVPNRPTGPSTGQPIPLPVKASPGQAALTLPTQAQVPVPPQVPSQAQVQVQVQAQLPAQVKVQVPAQVQVQTQVPDSAYSKAPQVPHPALPAGQAPDEPNFSQNGPSADRRVADSAVPRAVPSAIPLTQHQRSEPMFTIPSGIKDRDPPQLPGAKRTQSLPPPETAAPPAHQNRSTTVSAPENPVTAPRVAPQMPQRDTPVIPANLLTVKDKTPPATPQPVTPQMVTPSAVPQAPFVPLLPVDRSTVVRTDRAARDLPRLPQLDTNAPKRPQLHVAPPVGTTTAPIASITPARGEIEKPVPLSTEVGATPRSDGPATITPSTPAPTRLDTPHVAIRQIVEITQNMPNRPVEISLNPEELGRVRLSLTTVETGITLTVLADRPETLDLLRRHIGVLSQQLGNIGYGDVSFTFGQRDPQHQTTSHNTGDAPEMAETAETTITPPVIPATGLDLRL